MSTYRRRGRRWVRIAVLAYGAVVLLVSCASCILALLLLALARWQPR